MKIHFVKRLRSWMGPNIAMDLGTANTLVYTKMPESSLMNPLLSP